MMANNNHLKIGSILKSDTLGTDIHDAARSGNKRKLKKTLDRGLHVDYPNNEGQSPLYIACYENQPSSAEVLLLNGANPNERSSDGTTPVHMAAYSGNVRLLTDIITAGGDLRLHDNHGKMVKDWALSQPDPKKRLKMIEYLEKTRLFAMTKSGKDLRTDYKSLNYRARSSRKSSILHMIRDKIQGSSYDVGLDQLKSCQSMGFGKVYLDGDSTSGFMSTIPVITDSCLKHDSDSLSFENGVFMVMESMFWKSTKVTVKRLHREIEHGGEVDLLINETEHLGKIRHPNVLLLMGVCQTNNLDGLVLIFEHVGLGSLYYMLHEKYEKMSCQQITELLQQVCDALIFLHEQNLIHCFLTSHAINVITPHLAKVGNLEYAIGSEKSEIGRKTSVTMNMHENAAYNWMAPEIMSENPPSPASDMYSFSAILLETVQCEIPWGRCDAETVRYKVVVKQEQLNIDMEKIPKLFQIILEYGLQRDPLHRELTFNHVRKILELTPEKAKQYVLSLLCKKVSKSSIKSDWQKQRTKSGNRDGGTVSGVKPDRPSSTPNRKGSSTENTPNEKNNHNHSSNKYIPACHRSLSRKSSSPYQRMIKPTAPEICSDNIDGFYPNLKEQIGERQFCAELIRSKKDNPWNMDDQDSMESFLHCKVINPYRQTKSKTLPCQDHRKVVLCHNNFDDGDNLSDQPKESSSGETVSGKEPSESNSTCASLQELDSSMAKPLNLSLQFSYLNIKQQKNPTGISVKPASHCTDPNIEKAEEQLTTAGSVFALYNMDGDTRNYTPNKPTLQETLCSTMPRKRKRMRLTPNMKTNDIQFAKETGSVKNLVDLFQYQEDNHKFQQAVLTGNLKDYEEKAACMQEKKEKQIEGIREHKEKEQRFDRNNHGELSNIGIEGQVCSSMEFKDTGRYNNTISSSLTSVQEAAGCSSVESEKVEEFVHEELTKVHSSLCEEVFQALSAQTKNKPRNMCTEVNLLIRDVPFTGPSAEPGIANHQNHQRKGTALKKKTPKDTKSMEIEDFYFDDELTNNIKDNSGLHLQNISSPHRSRRLAQ